MVPKAGSICCSVVVVRSFALAIAQHSNGVHGAKFAQVQLSDMIADVIDPDFVVALAGAGSTLLLGPRQVPSLDEGGQCDSRICTETIAIDRLHE